MNVVGFFQYCGILIFFKILLTSIAFHVLSHACSKQKLNGRKKKYQKMTSSLNVRVVAKPSFTCNYF